MLQFAEAQIDIEDDLNVCWTFLGKRLFAISVARITEQ